MTRAYHLSLAEFGSCALNSSFPYLTGEDATRIHRSCGIVKLDDWRSFCKNPTPEPLKEVPDQVSLRALTPVFPLSNVTETKTVQPHHWRFHPQLNFHLPYFTRFNFVEDVNYGFPTASLLNSSANSNVSTSAGVLPSPSPLLNSPLMAYRGSIFMVLKVSTAFALKR